MESIIQFVVIFCRLIDVTKGNSCSKMRAPSLPVRCGKQATIAARPAEGKSVGTRGVVGRRAMSYGACTMGSTSMRLKKKGGYNHVGLPRQVCQSGGRDGSPQEDVSKFMDFSIDPFSDDEDGILEVPNLRSKLKARPSPFITTNNFGGGFVSNDDRVALSALKFASRESAGAQCMGMYDPLEGRGSGSDEENLCVPLPPWAYRAGARETIYMNQVETKVAGGLCMESELVVCLLVIESYMFLIDFIQYLFID